MKFSYIKTPLHRYTFSRKPMRDWVETVCEGKVLNLFAGPTHLNVDEIRNDIDPEMTPHVDYQLDAIKFVEMWQQDFKDKFNTILLDPPYSYRKSMELYHGHKASPFKRLKDVLCNVLVKDGIVITFGYHSVSMGTNRGFEIEHIALFSHGGAIHDTIATVERRGKKIV